MTTDVLDSPSPLGSPLVRAVAPFLEARTWGALAYVWLGFPLGLAWFVGLTVGIATGAALTIVWIGIVLLFVTFLAAWGAEGLERRLAIWLGDPHFLGVDIGALNRNWVARARRRLPVYAWTVKTAEQRLQAGAQADALIWEADGRPRN